MAAPSSPSRKYEVFISHAGEDKDTVAFPLRDMLNRQGIPAFVDEKDIRRGGAAIKEMTSAMENANVAVIVLSPEYVAKEWPMKELLFFLHRQEQCKHRGESLPVIIPVFYRLDVRDMYTEPDFNRTTADGRKLYEATRFFERRDKGEPEADVGIIQRALREVRGIMGVVNKYHASNDESSMPARQLLLNDICEMIAKAFTEHNIRRSRNERTANAADDTDQFRRYFHTEPQRNVVLDFENVDERGDLLTQEGRIKSRLLNGDRYSDQVIAIHGIGGVGKSTILKALANDEDLRDRFFDGIHFVSLGMNATDRTLIQGFSNVLHESGANEAATELNAEINLDTAVRQLKRKALSWFHEKSCLFLIDDVWTTELNVKLFSHMAKLGYPGRRSAVVFTTRELEVASVAANQKNVFCITPRGPEEAEDILFCHAGITESEVREIGSASSGKDKILDICNGLPVSLAAVGKGIKMLRIDMKTNLGDVCREYLMMHRNHREGLLREEVDDYGNLFITFGVSIALLERRRDGMLGFETPVGFPEMHRRLCVLRKQGKAPASMLRHLWELNNEREARVVGMHFVHVGLAESMFGDEVSGSHVWHLDLHDSIHDFATSEAKRNGDVVHAHEILLDGYTRSHRDLLSSTDGWATWWGKGLAEDDYMHVNVLHHLWEAGRSEYFDLERSIIYCIEHYSFQAQYVAFLHMKNPLPVVGLGVIYCFSDGDHQYLFVLIIWFALYSWHMFLLLHLSCFSSVHAVVLITNSAWRRRPTITPVLETGMSGQVAAWWRPMGDRSTILDACFMLLFAGLAISLVVLILDVYVLFSSFAMLDHGSLMMMISVIKMFVYIYCCKHCLIAMAHLGGQALHRREHIWL